jgi:hypothetical protein
MSLLMARVLSRQNTDGKAVYHQRLISEQLKALWHRFWRRTRDATRPYQQGQKHAAETAGAPRAIGKAL